MKDNSIPHKVLFVTHKYPPSIGGMQQQSYQLIQNYKAIGDCSIIAFNSKYPIWLFFIVVIPWITWRLIADPKINVIHGNDGLMGLFLTPFLLSKKKLFVTIHGLDIVYNISIYQWWIKNFLVKFNGVIAVSRETKNECVSRGLNMRKLHFIANAVDPIQIASKKTGFLEQLIRSKGTDLTNRTIITSVGRAIPRKGFSWFVKNIVPALSPKTAYVIVGPSIANEQFIERLQRILPSFWFRMYCQLMGIPIDSFELKKLSKKSEMKDRFHLIGKLSQEDLEQLYLHTDIFVMPNLKVKSDYEGFGLVAQEAVTAGALCLASDIDGIPSAIEDQKTGILLESGNAENWLKTLDLYLSNESLLIKTSKEFRDNMLNKDHSWSKMASQYHQVFNTTS